MAMVLYKNQLFVLGICFLCYMTYSLEAARSWDKHNERNFEDLNHRSVREGHRHERRYGPHNQDGGRRAKSEKPNIILILTDDQDEMLGSMTTMTKTLKIMGQEGVRFNNSFVSTPMCCPSRSTILTGMYPHNHHVYTNNDNCSGTEWQKTHEPRSFAKYLSDAGYRTGFFGKYLNEYNGTYVPPGWREWVGLVKNSRFYNYVLNFNGQKVKHDDNYYRDYFTDLIANDSVTFLKQSKQYFPDKPVMMMLSVPAPHGPEDAAPQFQHMFANNTFHRTPSWNYMNNSDKQWLLSEMKPMEPIGVAFTDILQQKRLQTLQSVDSLVEKVYYELRLLNELDNTYIIYTSDHGYHLGQFGIVKGKALPYDFDIRVPLYIRGPGILKDTSIPNVVGNVDLAPTILDMAGIDVPDHMDGRSMLKLIRNHKLVNNLEGTFVQTKRPWRDTILIERGKVSKQMMNGIKREQDNRIINEYTSQLIPYANPKLRRTLKICSDLNNQPPCKMNQKWVCFLDSRKRKRIKKCRNYNKTVTATPNVQGYQKDSPFSLPTQPQSKKCDCSKRAQGLGMNTEGERLQRDFLRAHVKDKKFDPRFMRYRRSLSPRSYKEDEMELKRNLIAQQLNFNRQRCRFFPNDTFACDRDITKDPEKWQSHKLQLDEMIEETRRRLRNLKRIRKNMKRQRKRLRKVNTEGNNSYVSYGDVTYNQGTSTSNLEEPCDCDDDDDTQIDIPPELREQKSDLDVDDDSTSREEETVNYYQQSGGKKRKKGKYCNHDDLKCTIQFNDHWKTPPYWTLGPFCYCTNANTNTYWCLRTVNETHNFLYCEFIDSFLSYYDLTSDPHQLQNQIKSLSYSVMHQLHEQLVELRRCVGGKQCNKNKYNINFIEKRRRRRRKVKLNRQSHRRRNKRI